MGNCQGRMCGPVLQEIIARERGLQATEIDYLNVRPPTKPIPLAAFSTNGEL